MNIEIARKVLKAELEAIEGLLGRLDERFEQEQRLSFRAQRGICLETARKVLKAELEARLRQGFGGQAIEGREG